MQKLKATASCPSCGAPFDLLEGANVARCPYCNLPLLFRSKRRILRYYLEPKVKRRSIPFWVDRHRKENSEPLPKRVGKATLFYLPFWRFTTQAFYTMINQQKFSPSGWTPSEKEKYEEILTREWDVNLVGHTSNDLGITTLGMRPDWLKLNILTDSDRLKQKGEVLSLEVGSKRAKKSGSESLKYYILENKVHAGELVLRFIEERLSLIYFPLWVVDFIAPEGKFFHVIDGITGRVLKQGSGCFEPRKSKSGDVETFHPLQIVPHRCPNCGWDLPVESFHLLFPCENCGKLWKIEGNGYGEMKGQIARSEEEPESGESNPPAYYPFWVFEAGLSRKKKSSIEEVFKLLPSEIGLFSVKDKSQPFLFCIPAFELANLKKVGDIALAYVRTQPQLKTEAMRNENLKGVFISEDDAKKIAELLWLKLISQKMNLDINKLKKIKLKSTGVVWCPCYKEGAFLRDAVIGYSFQKVG
jgi:predicted RNA-binding Zn-ribbon protein involved in translation (DUF1610 family)